MNKAKERIIEGFLFACAAVCVFTTIGIIVVLLVQSVQFFSEVSIKDFLTDTQWTPLFSDKHFGILPLITGTLLTTFVAIAIALPLGLSIAIYISEYATKEFRAIVKPMLEILAAVPTVVYGFFALTVVTPFLQKIFPSLAGFNAISPGIVMGIMIIPLISSLSEDALYAVPKSLREGAYALGSTTLQTAFKVIMPAASSGIIVSVILAISRAIGETMIVAIAAGQQPRLTLNPTVPIETVTTYIVQVSLGDVPHGSLEYKTIFAAGLSLFVLTFILNNVSFFIKKNIASNMNNERVKSLKNNLFKAWAIFATAFGLIMLGILVIKIGMDGAHRLSLAFFTDLPSRRASEAGIYTAWAGTLWIMATTALIAIPIGIGAGIYLEEYSKKGMWSNFLEINISNLAGVPSIIYGLLGLEFFVRFLNMGSSILAGSFTLALLILPIVIVSTREALKAVPKTLREASYALGASKWQTIWMQVLPASLGGVMTGIILALSRAMGETAPLIVVGALTYVPFVPKSVMDSFTVLPIQIFNWTSRPQAEFLVNAAAAIIVLLIITLLMNGTAVLLRNRWQKNVKW